MTVVILHRYLMFHLANYCNVMQQKLWAVTWCLAAATAAAAAGFILDPWSDNPWSDDPWSDDPWSDDPWSDDQNS